MRRRRDREARRPVSAVARIQNDLERRGISRNFSGAAAARLEGVASDLNDTEYVALLDGVAAAPHRQNGRAAHFEFGHRLQCSLWSASSSARGWALSYTRTRWSMETWV